MSDRELLKLAAKAAGHRLVQWVRDGNGVEVAIIVRSDGDGFSMRPWQPLHENQMTDCDGDALRLAVKLSLRVHHDGFCAIVELPPVRRTYLTPAYFSDEGNDLYADTRRAITRAAAEIGKGMP